MSNKHLKWHTKVLVGSPTDRFILMILCDMANEDSICWPSQKLLSERTQFSERTVKKALAKLTDDGFIAVNKTGIRNCYYLPMVDSQGKQLSTAVEHLTSISGEVSDDAVEHRDENNHDHQEPIQDEKVQDVPLIGAPDSPDRCESNPFRKEIGALGSPDRCTRFPLQVQDVPLIGAPDSPTHARSTGARVLTPKNPQLTQNESSSSSSVIEKNSELNSIPHDDEDFSMIFKNLKYPPTPERYQEQLMRFHENARILANNRGLSFGEVKHAVERAILRAERPIGNLHAFGMAVIENPRTFTPRASEPSQPTGGLSRKQRDHAFLKEAFEQEIQKVQDQGTNILGELAEV